MFRALGMFQGGVTKVTMEPPLSVTLIEKGGSDGPKPVDLALTPDDVFTTAVGHTGKRTLASWHVTTPAEVVESMLVLVNGESTEAKSSL